MYVNELKEYAEYPGEACNLKESGIVGTWDHKLLL